MKIVGESPVIIQANEGFILVRNDGSLRSYRIALGVNDSPDNYHEEVDEGKE